MTYCLTFSVEQLGTLEPKLLQINCTQYLVLTFVRPKLYLKCSQNIIHILFCELLLR